MAAAVLGPMVLRLDAMSELDSPTSYRHLATVAVVGVRCRDCFGPTQQCLDANFGPNCRRAHLADQKVHCHHPTQASFAKRLQPNYCRLVCPA